MSNTNICFGNKDIDLLKSFIGKKMISFCCDEFDFKPSVYGLVGIRINKSNLVISNMNEPIDYFGAIEDISVLKILIDQKLEKSLLKNKNLIVNNIDNKILKIYIVNDMYQIEKEDGNHQINITKGIVFEFEENYQIGFEKDVFFSEEIIIHKGYNVISQFINIDEFKEEFDKQYKPNSKRSILEL